MKYVSLLIASALLFGAVVQVQAVPTIFDFTGSVTQVPVLDPIDPFSGTIAFGTTFSGSFTFESTTPDALLADPQTGVYGMAGPPFGMTVDINGNLFSATDFLNISVADDYAGPTDQYTVLALAIFGGPLSTDLTLELFFQDDTATVFSSDALPLTPPPLSSFVLKGFHLIETITDTNSGEVTEQVQIDGQLNSLTSVPEPCTMFLLGSGLAGVWMFRRFKKQ